MGLEKQYRSCTEVPLNHYMYIMMLVFWVDDLSQLHNNKLYINI